MEVCPAFAVDAPYVSALIAFVDCQGRALGQDGYAALAAGGSPVAVAIGGLMTILVALFGYRIILDDAAIVREAILLLVRIGVVLAFTTQWSAYRTVIYDVVVEGPGELASEILRSDLASIERLPDRVQRSYDALERLAHPPLALASAPPPAGAAAEAPAMASPLRVPLTTAEQGRLSASSVILLLSSLAALLSVRVLAGIMLALGPLFLATLLFAGLRGLFEGWIRVLAGTALGSVAGASVLTFELAVLEPQLARLLDAAGTRPFPSTGAIEVFTTTLLFATILAAALAAGAWAAAGFRLPVSIQISGERRSSRLPATDEVIVVQSHPSSRDLKTPDQVPRHGHAAPAIGMEQGSTGIDPARRVHLHHREGKQSMSDVEPLGQANRPRLSARRTVTAARRDRRA